MCVHDIGNIYYNLEAVLLYGFNCISLYNFFQKKNYFKFFKVC